MRDVELPIGETVSFSFSPSFSDDFEQIDNGDGTVTLKGQSIGSDQFADLKKARENGGKVLYAVIYIEQQMDEIITRHFLGGSSHYYERLPLFEDSILHAVLGFHHKKEIVFKIAGERDKIGKKQKGKLQKQLTDLMRWRNAFAHGKVMYDTKDGCFIEFHSGGKKQYILNDEFWGKIEIAYSESIYYYGDMADDLNVYKCDVLFEFDNIRRVRVGTTFEGKDRRQYWKDSLVIIPEIPTEKVEEYSGIYNRRQQASAQGFEAARQQFLAGTGRDYVWLNFPKDEWERGRRNYKPICYVSDVGALVAELNSLGAIDPQDTIKFLTGSQGHHEKAFSSLADLYLSAQQSECGNILVTTSDASKLAKGFDQIKIKWALDKAWLSAENVNAAANGLRRQIAQIQNEKKLAEQAREAERKAKQQAYDECTASAECKAQRDRQKQAEIAEERARIDAYNARYPYIAYVDCLVGGQSTYWAPCFNNARVTVDGRTKAFNVASMASSTHANQNRNELQFELSPEFQFMVQGNGDHYMTIRVIIRDRSGNVVFEDQKNGYGVIKVTN